MESCANMQAGAKNSKYVAGCTLPKDMSEYVDYVEYYVEAVIENTLIAEWEYGRMWTIWDMKKIA